MLSISSNLIRSYFEKEKKLHANIYQEYLENLNPERPS